MLFKTRLQRQIVRLREVIAPLGVVSAIGTLLAVPVVAETANYGSLTLSRGFESPTAILKGSTGGSYSLSSVANSDDRQNKCLGFATPTPDHILVLKQNFSRLTLQVNSGGGDTTLLIQGPDDRVLCGDDTQQNKDAKVTDGNWKAGLYRVWVGSLETGMKYNYTLSVQE